MVRGTLLDSFLGQIDEHRRVFVTDAGNFAHWYQHFLASESVPRFDDKLTNRPALIIHHKITDVTGDSITRLLSSIRLDGTTACMAIEGATDTEIFQAYVRAVFCPPLRPGDVVVMDNLSPHKNQLTLERIEQVGATVCFLAAYSPDFNPIEKMWSKVKQFLRSARARTGAELLTAIAVTLQTITHQDSVNWFVSCGYSFI
jgi:hypothetical protein